MMTLPVIADRFLVVVVRATVYAVVDRMDSDTTAAASISAAAAPDR